MKGPLHPFEQGEIGPFSSATPAREGWSRSAPAVATAGLIAGSRSMSRAKMHFPEPGSLGLLRSCAPLPDLISAQNKLRVASHL